MLTFENASYQTFAVLKKTMRKFKKRRLNTPRKALLAAFFKKYLAGNPDVDAATIHTQTNEYNCEVFYGTVDGVVLELSVSKAAKKHA